jgi:hypothetical protein
MHDLPYGGEIQREFPITSGEYTVIIKDGRTVNPADQDLAELGVIGKFETLLGAVPENGSYLNISPRGLMVVVESGVDYTDYRAIDGNTIGANLQWVLETANIASTLNRNRFTLTLGSMDTLDFTQR